MRSSCNETDTAATYAGKTNLPQKPPTISYLGARVERTTLATYVQRTSSAIESEETMPFRRLIRSLVDLGKARYRMRGKCPPHTYVSKGINTVFCVDCGRYPHA